MKYTYYKNEFHIIRMAKNKDDVFYQVYLDGIKEWSQQSYMSLSEWKSKGLKQMTKEEAFLELL